MRDYHTAVIPGDGIGQARVITPDVGGRATAVEVGNEVVKQMRSAAG